MDLGAIEAELPSAVLDIFRALVARPPVPLADLHRALDRYAEQIALAGRSDPFLDIDLGVRLVTACRGLLGAVDPGSAEQRRLVQAAVLYLVSEDDADPDFSDMAGFDDDRLVVDLVALELGRKDLVVGG